MIQQGIRSGITHTAPITSSLDSSGWSAPSAPRASTPVISAQYQLDQSGIGSNLSWSRSNTAPRRVRSRRNLGDLYRRESTNCESHGIHRTITREDDNPCSLHLGFPKPPNGATFPRRLRVG